MNQPDAQDGAVESTILIANYRRNRMLRLNLQSLLCQDLQGTQILILDDTPEGDDECKAIIQEFAEHYPLDYLHTGANKTGDFWRVPGFAFNIGARQTSGRFLFLCCAEIYHRNATFPAMLEVLRSHETSIMAIPQGKSDSNGRITDLIEKHGSLDEKEFLAIRARLLVRYPFFMGMARSDFEEIGGYDEDYIGVGVEDKDLVERLMWRGCRYVNTTAQIVHLHHSRARSGEGLDDGITDRLQYNRDLFQKKKGQIVRNQGRQWGKL
jgi:hypothetical protein